MSLRTGVALGLGAGALAVVQIAAWLVYRGVEKGRTTTAPSQAFEYEAASGPAPALDVPLELPDGSIVRLRQYPNEAVIVHFWATWCAPCRTELPALLALRIPFNLSAHSGET